MNCPNCGAGHEDGALECSGCGVIFAKWRARTERAAQAAAAEQPAQEGELVEHLGYRKVLPLRAELVLAYRAADDAGTRA